MRGELLGGLADRLVGLDRPVGPDLEDQLVPVGLLANAGLLDEKIRLDNRAEDRIDRDHADRLALFLIALGGVVAFSTLDGQRPAKPAPFPVKRGDGKIPIDGLAVTWPLGGGRLCLLLAAFSQGS